MVNRDGISPSAKVNITISRNTLSEYALGQINIDEIIKNDTIIEGDKHILKSLGEILDNFPAWFPIARHNLKFEED